MFYVLRKARKLSLPIDILLQLFDAMVAACDINSVKSFKNTENNRGYRFPPALHQYLMEKI
jgi:hypothetical protein